MSDKIFQLIFVIIFSPLLIGVINRVKALFAGRRGRPLFQLYYDIFKLFKKGAVYSVTTSGLFALGPIINLIAVLAAASFIPFAGMKPLISFEGDIILFIYLLALGRFFTVLAALDTGSSFEGMGASREMQFALFAEPAFFLSLAVLARETGALSVGGILSGLHFKSWSAVSPELFLVMGALFILLLAENSRIPVDDPDTHLELTMIHEVMVLDHGGVDLAYIFSGMAVKFWIFGALIAEMFLGGYSTGITAGLAVFACALILVAIVTGIVESTLARLRLLKVPHFLIVAMALSILALTFTMR